MLDIEEEREYTQLRNLGRRLHIPIPEAFWTLEVFDKDGKLIQKHHQRSHSWTRNAYNVMFSQLAAKNADDVTFEAGKLSAKDTGGTIRGGDHTLASGYAISSSPPWRSAEYTGTCYMAAGGDDSLGIIVGSGTNAENLEDFDLQTQIVEGTGPDQISHAASEAHSVSYAGTTLKDELIRYFNNNSGGNINVNEVGLASNLQCTTAVRYDCLMARDHLAATITVPDTGQLKVTYTIQLTYPA